MRKIIVITTIIIIVMVLTGCGNETLGSKQNGTSSKTTPQAATNQQSNTKDSAATSVDNSTSNQTTGATAIVAKSENIMSSSDKEELLNEVDKELDSLFNSINKLEDTQDADLESNQR